MSYSGRLSKYLLAFVLVVCMIAGCNAGSPLDVESPEDIPDVYGCPVTGHVDNCVTCHN